MRTCCILSILLLLLMMLSISLASPSSDDCDWTGSGIPEIVQSRGVQPIYLRCVQGTIQWQYPQGALRVLLRHGLTGSEFRACLRVSNSSSGARMFLTGPKKLHLMFKRPDPAELVKCVTSRNGQMSIYVEADPVVDVIRKRVVEFSYHLKKLSSTTAKDYEEDCRPCTEEELLLHYCSSDFVVQGTVSSLFHNSVLRRSEVTVRATKVFRDSEPPAFRDLPLASGGSFERYATLHRPLNCGTKAGNGEFIFLGRWVLGSPTLTCAPRLVEWKRVKRKAIKKGINQCQLDT